MIAPSPSSPNSITNSNLVQCLHRITCRTVTPKSFDEIGIILLVLICPTDSSMPVEDINSPENANYNHILCQSIGSPY